LNLLDQRDKTAGNDDPSALQSTYPKSLLDTLYDADLTPEFGVEYAIREVVDFRKGLKADLVFGEPGGLLHSLNHAAIACEKLAERAMANRFLLQGLNYCDAIRDEFGSIEQLALIGQIMFRRRDMNSACLWYLEAGTTLRRFTTSRR